MKGSEKGQRKIGEQDFAPAVSLRPTTGSGIQQALLKYLGMNEISSL